MRLLTILFVLFTLSCKPSNEIKESTSQIINSSFFSNELQAEIAYNVYLPAQFNDSLQFPILYLLHGHGGSENDWIKKDEGNIQFLLDSLSSLKAIPPMVAVTMNAKNTWYVDAFEKMESAFIKELIPLIESKFNLNPELNSRIIAGNSAGGYGALRFSLKYPELFQASILLSPAAYYPEPPPNSSSRKIPIFKKNGEFDIDLWQSYSYIKLLDSTNSDKRYPVFYNSTGDDDEYKIVTVVTDLKSYFDQLNISNELLIIDGGHSWEVWRYCLAHDLTRIFNEN